MKIEEEEEWKKGTEEKKEGIIGGIGVGRRAGS